MILCTWVASRVGAISVRVKSCKIWRLDIRSHVTSEDAKVSRVRGAQKNHSPVPWPSRDHPMTIHPSLSPSWAEPASRGKQAQSATAYRKGVYKVSFLRTVSGQLYFMYILHSFMYIVLPCFSVGLGQCLNSICICISSWLRPFFRWHGAMFWQNGLKIPSIRQLWTCRWSQDSCMRSSFWRPRLCSWSQGSELNVDAPWSSGWNDLFMTVGLPKNWWCFRSWEQW